jgi:hypothetical protein
MLWPQMRQMRLLDLLPIAVMTRLWHLPFVRWTMRCRQPDSFEQHGRDIFEGIVEGLKKFDASGRFKGKLPREQMLLVLWINDPAEHNAKAVMKWVEQMNPKPVAEWFNAVYSYRP